MWALSPFLMWESSLSRTNVVFESGLESMFYSDLESDSGFGLLSYAGCPGLRLEAESRLVHQMFISSPLQGGIRLFHFRDFVSLIVCCNFLYVDKLYSGWISYSEILYESVNNTILVWDPWHCVSTIFSQSFHITLPIWSQPWERNYWIKHST